MSVAVRKRKWSNKGRSGEAWQVDIAFSQTDGTSVRKRCSFNGTKPEAQDWGRRAENALRAGLPVPAKHTTTDGKEDEGTFEAFAARFLQVHCVKNKPSERGSKETIIRKWLVPQFGTLALGEITVVEVETFRAYLLDGAGLSPKRTNNILTVLRTIMGKAFEFELIHRMPTVERLTLKDPDIKAFDDEEAALLLQHMDPMWRTMLLLALRTGMRLGELRGLRWMDVDLRGRKVHIRQAFSREVLGSPKGNRSRTVDLTEEAAAALSTHPRHLRSEYVFTRADGSHLGAHEAYPPMEAAREAAGITWSAPGTPGKNGRQARGGRKAGWHTCRHTFISRLVALGVPLNVVQALAGHVNIKETLRYAHFAPSATRNAVALLDGTKSVAQSGSVMTGAAGNQAQA